MSILMMLAMGSKRALQPFSQTFNANGTWTRPAGVTVADISGYGSRGQDASMSSGYYYVTRTIYATRRSNGVREVVFTSSPEFRVGPSPGAYCDPVGNTPTDPVYSSNQTCYSISGAVGPSPTPATRGASASGLGKTFQGSLGNVPQTTTTFTAVPVTASSNPIVVPTGGTITISWLA